MREGEGYYGDAVSQHLLCSAGRLHPPPPSLHRMDEKRKARTRGLRNQSHAGRHREVSIE